MGGDKDILPIDTVKMVDVPRYEELSVKAVLPLVEGDVQLFKYLPDKSMSRGKIIDRAYFFNVLNTMRKDFLHHIVTEA
jgi:hypothetical protein